MGTLADRMSRDVRRLVGRKQLNSAQVSASWNATLPPADPNIESSFAAPAPVSGTWTGLVHFVGPATTGVRTFAEITAGDVLIDLPGDVVLPPRGAVFAIEGHDGQKFVQKEAGAELAEYWDVVCEGRKMLRTLLLTRAP